METLYRNQFSCMDTWSNHPQVVTAFPGAEMANSRVECANEVAWRCKKTGKGRCIDSKDFFRFYVSQFLKVVKITGMNPENTVQKFPLCNATMTYPGKCI